MGGFRRALSLPISSLSTLSREASVLPVTSDHYIGIFRGVVLGRERDEGEGLKQVGQAKGKAKQSKEGCNSQLKLY